MARACSICTHPRLYEINKRLAARAIGGRGSGLTYASIAKEFGVSKDALANHWNSKGHNLALEPPGAEERALIPQSERPQSVILADGTELRTVGIRELVETALAIGFHNIRTHPEIMTPQATARFLALALKWGKGMVEVDAYGKAILESILKRAVEEHEENVIEGEAREVDEDS